jgi:4-hydroxybenzoate polyprenyltransferase
VATETEARPAFYALASGGWRDYLTLLHAPYTAWHLAYVAIGAALTPEFALSRLLPTLGAFFLAVGIGAHALDELRGRPLRTRISEHVLVALAVVSIAAAVAIGVAGAVLVNPWIVAFVAAGAFIVVAYNLELFGGRFHGDAWFALAWGAFPLVTGFFAVAEDIDAAAILGAAFAFALSLAQRRLSSRVRDVRRRVSRVIGTVERHDGSSQQLTAADLMDAEEGALRVLAAATVALAAALVMMRLW